MAASEDPPSSDALETLLREVARVSPALEPGRALGRYRIEGRLGAGGMGVVYRARDQELEREVAIKMLPADRVRDEELLRRFAIEAKAASGLSHPGIVAIHDIGKTEDGDRYIAMELVRGETLRARLGRGLPELRDAVDWLAQAAGAAGHAHAAGIVHRDLKPENLMVTADGYLKVLDFGLAKLLDRGLPETRSGAIVGTVGYMAPEQARGDKIDARTDVFALGCILYEALSGKRPFEASSAAATLHRIATHEPPLEPAERFPGELARIVKRCLAKAPERRYPDARALAEELVEVRRLIDSASIAILHTQRRRRGALALAAVVALLIAGGAWLARQKPAPRLVKIEQLTHHGKARAPLAVSPDGKLFAYVRTEGDTERTSLWLHQIASASEVQLAPWQPLTRITGIAFSPDGSFVYIARQDMRRSVSAVYRLPAVGGTPQLVREQAHGPMSIAPDGSAIAYPYRRPSPSTPGTELRIAPLEGGEPRVLAQRNPVADGAWLWSAQFSPDGKRIAFIDSHRTPTFSSTVSAVDIATGTSAPLTQHRWRGINQALAWRPDGSGIFVNGSTRSHAGDAYELWEIALPSGEVRKVTDDGRARGGVAIDASGTALLSVGAGLVASIWVANAAAPNAPRRVTSGAGRYQGISWTPDGRLVYASTESGNWDVWSMDADGGQRRQLTHSPTIDLYPVVSPDGKSIAFTSERGEAAQVWLMDIDGGNQRPLTKGFDIVSSWSADGKWVLFTSTSRNPQNSAWKVPAAGGEPERLIEGFSNSPTCSPDGATIAVAAWSEERGSTMALVPWPGGAALRHFPRPDSGFNLNREGISFTPDGKALAFLDDRSGVANLWVQPLDGSPARALTDFQADPVRSYSWSRDGKRIAFVRGLATGDVERITGF